MEAATIIENEHGLLLKCHSVIMLKTTQIVMVTTASRYVYVIDSRLKKSKLTSDLGCSDYNILNRRDVCYVSAMKTFNKNAYLLSLTYLSFLI
jgi:hypothetical protein